MTSRNTSKEMVGVIGSGSFGTVIANLLAQQTKVILYTRSQNIYDELVSKQSIRSMAMHENVQPTLNFETIASNCEIIFPVVPSANFRNMIRDLAPNLHPYHILIHATKGFDTSIDYNHSESKLDRSDVHTMSEVIQQESVVVKTGCLAGPNLAKELAINQPAATVIASRFEEVIHHGQRLLRSDRFQVYGSSDITGIELCGILKNIIAIAAGILHGLGFGENAKALLISRGLVEMIYLGSKLGGNIKAFIGLAGVGDLVATCSSTLSRNFTVGQLLAEGQSLSEIMNDLDETAEGVRTIKVAYQLTKSLGIRSPITEILYKILYQDLKVNEALNLLMKFPMQEDIDFL